MEPKEFDNIINEALEDETRKIIEEQLDKTDKLIDAVKSFQSLSGMVEKIDGVEGLIIDNARKSRIHGFRY